MRLARAGSAEAWTAIYEEHFPAIYRYVRARIFDEAAAADVASSVFVAAISGIRSYSYRGRPLLAWLYRIAFSAVGEHQRRAVRERKRRGRLPEERNGQGPLLEPVFGNNLTDPDAVVDGLDLRAALDSLPDAQRDVLILRFFVGLETPEIARVMGKQPPAVYSLQARAVGALRSALQPPSTNNGQQRR